MAEGLITLTTYISFGNALIVSLLLPPVRLCCNTVYNYKGRYGPRTFSNRFFPSLGNHDYYTRNGEAYRDYFTLPGNGRYYDFVRGDVHLFALNSDPAEPDGISATSVQAQWLRAALAASTSRWNVVYLHHAPYSSARHGGAAMALSGVGCLGGGGGPRPRLRALAGRGPALPRERPGGRSLYRATRPREAQSQLLYSADYGAMRFVATPDSLTMEFFTRKQELINTHVLHQALSPEPKLYPVSPNPFRETTLVTFSLPTAATVASRVLNSLGQEVATLRQGPARAGWHAFEWARQGLPAGLYYLQLRGDGFSRVTKVQID